MRCSCAADRDLISRADVAVQKFACFHDDRIGELLNNSHIRNHGDCSVLKIPKFENVSDVAKFELRNQDTTPLTPLVLVNPDLVLWDMRRRIPGEALRVAHGHDDE